MSEIKSLLKALIAEIAEIRITTQAIKKQMEQLHNVSITEKEFLTLEEASKLSGLAPKTLRKYVAKGILSRYGSARKVLIAKSELKNAIQTGFKPSLTICPNEKIRPIRVRGPEKSSHRFQRTK